ncbi:MAG: hypothetical protein MUP63_02825 [Candidatus Nanohaloarchaeota archaeon QJJ-7]|nr:hypothetical protein [Candidatus Nanohaloarchaeota archaeon QJJ-7]
MMENRFEIPEDYNKEDKKFLLNLSAQGLYNTNQWAGLHFNIALVIIGVIISLGAFALTADKITLFEGIPIIFGIMVFAYVALDELYRYRKAAESTSGYNRLYKSLMEDLFPEFSEIEEFAYGVNYLWKAFLYRVLRITGGESSESE